MINNFFLKKNLSGQKIGLNENDLNDMAKLIMEPIFYLKG